MAAPARHPPESRPLPGLRQDLRLERGADSVTGAPTWIVFDPLANTYTQIDETAYQLLSIWGGQLSADRLAGAARERFGLEVGPEQIEGLADFLAVRRLTEAPREGGWQALARSARQHDQGWIVWAIHNYLMVKLPLVRPQRFLDATLPYVLFLFSRRFWLATGAAALTGLYLVSRQWEAFTGTFMYLFSWEGLLLYGAALAAVKVLHELGHAYTATRLGCRVPTMGVTFMVLMPMLYTDVTDAWRLTSRRQRMTIDAAGMMVELMLAAFATLAWAFLPDGPLRSVAFLLATAGWTMSLAVNLNPLMRFDGYYLLSDALGVDNLQERAFAVGRWRMRELLFGLGAPPPEPLPRRTRRFLALYAWLVWIYRLVLFTGIALMVYHFAFKALGLVLFGIEIVYFVLRPIGRETAVWWREGRTIRARPRAWITSALSIALVTAALVPWSTRIELPAVAEAAELTRLFPARAGEIASVHVAPGEVVAAGRPIVTLRSPELEHEIALAGRRIALVELRLARRGVDESDRAKSLTLERELLALRTRRAGLERELAELVIRAPHAGEVAELGRELHPGRYVGRTEPIALVRGTGTAFARGYVGEHALARIADGAAGQFAPDNALLPRVPVHLRSVSSAAAASIEIPELASTYGGALAVRPQPGPNGRERLVPEASSYLAVFKFDIPPFPAEKAERGIVTLDGRAESLASRAWRQILKVLVRESGF